MQNFCKKLGMASLFLLLAPNLVWASSGFQSGLDLVKSLFGGGFGQDQTLSQLILDFIQLLLMFAGPLAVLFVIIGGFYYITSAGNEEQAQKGKRTLLNALIGIIIVVLSYTIVTVLQNTISGLS